METPSVDNTDNMDFNANKVPEPYMEPVLEERIYLQWYEADESRLDEETARLQRSFPEFERIVLNDARLCFSGSIEDEPILVVCGYNYPLAPPEFFYLGDDSYRFVDSDGRIDVLSLDSGIHWDANSILISDLLERVGILFRLEKKAQEGAENDATDTKGHPTDDRPMGAQVSGDITDHTPAL
jgi:hypothetical protein